MGAGSNNPFQFNLLILQFVVQVKLQVQEWVLKEVSGFLLHHDLACFFFGGGSLNLQIIDPFFAIPNLRQ